MAPKKRSSAKSSRASSAVPPIDSDIEITEVTGTNSPATSIEEEAKDATFDPAQEEKEQAVAQEDFVKEAKPKVRSTFGVFPKTRSSGMWSSIMITELLVFR